MKIAITGATGFIGKTVVKYFLKKKVKPIILVRNKSLLPKYFSKCKIFKVDLIKIDKNFYSKIGKPDVLIHLAWGGLPNYNSKKHLSKELPMQFKFLKKMISSGLKNLFVTGTCFEYGLIENEIKETTKPKPISNYGKAKKSLFLKLSLLSKKYKFNLIWARLFYIYGIGQPDRSLIGQLVNSVKKKKTYFNMSNGEQLRDYMRVEDVAKNIINFAFMKKNLGPINLCSGKPIKVKNLVKNICKKNNWKIKLNLGFYELPKNEPKNFWGIPNKNINKNL
jgi:nucleoside-diphosphate-sugar epimerase